MRIQHNIPMIRARNNFSRNNNKISKSLEKLSSGYRINRAGDDAAGLAVSEKMRAQITALAQAEENSLDGISLIQTAEGGMEEIHSMMNRIAELSTQAANGIYSDEDRQIIQEEVNEILNEIERIGKSTNFNGIPLLQGDNATITKPPVATVKGGLPTWVTSQQMTDKYLSGEYETSETYEITNADGTTTQQSYTIKHAAAYLDFSALDSDPSKLQDLLKQDTGFFTTCCTCDRHYSIKFTDDTTSKMEQSGTHYIYSIGIKGVNTSSDLIDRIIAGAGSGNPQGHYTKLVKDSNKLVIYDDRATSLPSVSGGSWINWNNPYTAKPYPNNDNGLFGEGVAYRYESSTITYGDVVLQIGEDASAINRLGIDLPDMSLTKIGIAGLSIATQTNAFLAIEKAKDGINYISSERGRMGSYQNRLEHTINNLSVTNENMTASESRIRDTDMAKEMMKLTKDNIISQAAQSMLAQANSQSQQVLAMLNI